MIRSIKYFLLFSGVLLIITGIVFRNKIPNFIGNLFAPVSVISKVSSSGSLKNTDGRTNFLILGMDKRTVGNGNVRSILVDTIMVISVDSGGNDAVIISVPRDLWIESAQSKINAVYALSGFNVEAIREVTEEVIGIPMHYYVMLGFDAFIDAIEVVDGISVTVDETFDDYQYPIEGKETAYPESERYMHIRFDAGVQKMDGDMALKYSRSRHSTNISENGDFARARRQQKVLMALKDKIISMGTLFNPSKLVGLFEVFKGNVETNVSVSELNLFYSIYKNFSDRKITRIVLSNEPYDSGLLGSSVLYAPTQEERSQKYRGQYVLVPSDKTFNEIQALIRKALFD